jgi:PAS domain S-box-containing protein
MSNPAILIVEDEAIISADLASKLRKLGYEIIGETDTGEEAIEIARKMCPSLVLMDIRLSGAMDGITAADTIRQECRLPVVFLTALSDNASVQHMLRKNIFEYIMKPFDDRELHMKIEMALYKHATEQRLIDSESRLREVLENSLVASYKRNLQTNAFEYLSPVFTRISGYTSEEIKSFSNENIMKLIHPDDLAEMNRVIADSMSTAAGTEYQLEYRFRHQDGRYRWIHHQFAVMRDAGGQPLAHIGSIGDISERKQAEMTLLETKHFLQTTLDSLSANIALLDEHGVILLVNKAWCDFAKENGILAEKVSKGCNYLDVCDHGNGTCMEEAKPFFDGIREVLSGKIKSFSLEYPCHSPSEERWFVGRVTRFPDDGPRCVVIAHENITERKRAEQERMELSQQKQQIQKAESLSLAAGAIALQT